MLRLSHHFEGKRHVIWDWNGTLLNDVDVTIEVASEVLQDYGYPAVEPEAYRRLVRFPIRDYYREIGVDFERTPFEEMSLAFIRKYKARFRECRLYDGVEELLEHLVDRDVECSILSAANQADLYEMLEELRLTRYFRHVFARLDHEGGEKIARGEALLKTIGAPKQDLLMVGDTDHDALVARTLGIDALIFADGHQHLETILATHENVLPSRYPAST